MSRDSLYEAGYKKKNNIETTENDLKIEQITKSNNANQQVKAPLTPKQGKGCLTRVLNTYQQLSLDCLRLYVF